MAQYQNNVSCKKCNSLGIVGYYLSTHTQAQYNTILNLKTKLSKQKNRDRVMDTEHFDGGQMGGGYGEWVKR